MKKKTIEFLHTIRARILLSTIALMIFISIISTGVSYVIVSENLRQNLIRTTETRLSFLCTSINSNLNNVTAFIRACQTSSKISDFAIEDENSTTTAKREAKDFLSENYGSNALISRQLIRMVIISNTRSDILQLTEASRSSVTVTSEAVRSLEYFGKMQENLEKTVMGVVNDPFLSTRNVKVIPVLHAIPHPFHAGDIGYIFTEMSTSVITDSMQSYLTDTDVRFYFRLGDHQYEYRDGELWEFNDEFVIVKDLSSYITGGTTVIQVARTSDGSEHSVMITQPLDTKDWYVTLFLDNEALKVDILPTLLPIVLLITVLATVIGIMFGMYLNRTINVPVKILQKRIAKISEGDFSRDSATEWQHELGMIGRNINELAENISRLMEQRVRDEREKKDYEYRMLQSQINPHFLYNTLNSIKWMATIQNASGIAEMTTSLSRLLKNISKGTSSIVSIEHELRLIEDYFTIQKYRYGAISMNIRVDSEDLRRCSILIFTLQPIVENAIFHGIEPSGSAGTIDIHIYADSADVVHIDVTDDGVGMSAEMVQQLLDDLPVTKSSFFKEIGIVNVHRRLRYEFGERYGLTVSSEPGKFTTVSVLLPYKTEEEGRIE